MDKVICFGELLLRLSPVAHGEWIRQHAIATYVGGAEANVATALARWGVPVKYATSMPDNYMARDVAAYLEGMGIDTSAVHYSGKRLGTYYMQQGADLKHAGVFYDRAHSSFYELKPGMINWEEALKGVSWFHFSAISPALNEDAVAVCREALEAASARGITISVDLNYRAKLWQYGKKPTDVMPELVQYCDLVMGNIWAANTLLGIEVDRDIERKNDKGAYLDHAAKTAEAIISQYPKCRTVANTFRFDHNEQGIRYYTSLYTGGQSYVSVEFLSDHIIDRAGSGDCFMGGLIYGFTRGHNPQDIINFSASAAFGKLNETGDATGQSEAHVMATLKEYEQKEKFA